MQSLAHDLFSLKAAPTVEELNRRYRSICKAYHPDLQQESERALGERSMQVINSAYTDALARFNMLRRNTSPQRSTASGPSVSVSVGGNGEDPMSARATPYKSSSDAPPSARFSGSVAAAKMLGAALATLKRTRCFYSLTAANEEREREQLVAGISELQLVVERQQGSREAQDALFYQAMALCNLREYRLALRLFTQYSQRYPADSRDGAFHFYRGLLHHRLGQFELAVHEYGSFLSEGHSGQYKHFLALVATFQEAARLSVIPNALPYS